MGKRSMKIRDSMKYQKLAAWQYRRDKGRRRKSMSAGRLLLSMLTASLVLSAADAATAQPYPQRPVKLIVSLVAGSPADLVARSIADKLSASLKQTFVVDNRPGAHGNLASEFVA